MRRLFLHIGVMALLVFSGTNYAFAADPVIARGFVNKRTVLIGDRVRYTIEAKRAKDIDIEFPVFADKRIGDFEIKDSGQVIKKGFFGAIKEARWYDIASYTVGKHTIPEVVVMYGIKGKADKNNVSVKPLDVAVESVLPKGGTISDIKDIKPPIGIPEVLRNIIIVIAGIMIISALVWAYIKFLKRKPIKLPHEMAMEELEAHKGVYARAGDVKLYYIGISDSVRRYIERVFRVRAPEMTTEEFLVSLGSSGSLSAEEKARLREFLGSCDLVKFAKYAPDKDEADAVLNTARKFIEETKDVHV
jgi:hypothetical protein